VLAEINGYFIGGERDGQPLDNFNQMTSDGTTAGGCWIYAGVYSGGENMAARRRPRTEQDETAAEWAWAWPANRRILYNRASAAPDGTPWSERKKFVWWDEDAGKWTGKDVPDFPIDRAPAARSDQAYGGPAHLDGDDPFIMQADGKGWLFAPSGMVDGPMPTHYEPQESGVPNPLYPQQNSPNRMVMRRGDNLSAPGAGLPGSEVYPYVFTTYRLTEHHTAGGMSRWLPYLSELQPEMFCEISPELAAEVGLEPYGWATLISPRAAIEARVLVTRRMTPLTIGGRTVHQIGLPYHWGVGGTGAVIEGDSANDLLGVTMDPNVYIQNSKYVAGSIIPGRRPRGAELVDFVEKYQREAGLTPESGNQQVTVSAEDLAASQGTSHGTSRGGHAHRGGDSAVGVTPARTHGGDPADDTAASATVDSADDRSGRVDLEPVETAVANRADDGDPTDGDPDHGRHADGSPITADEVAAAEARAFAARARSVEAESEDGRSETAEGRQTQDEEKEGD
jgi:formate dehydrogenase major subunit